MASTLRDARYATLAGVTAIVLCGTIYSVAHNTYLDTSNPLLTNLPHPLHADHYFASKSNVVNVYFIKRIWAWTTAAFLALIFTRAPSADPRAPTHVRVLQYITATSVWLAFTSWFFGPSVLERLITSTGGECVLHLPSGSLVTVPLEHCYSHAQLSPTTHPALFAASLVMPDKSWAARPRLRRGHDVSGHIFLLTLSVLFLVDQLRASARRPRREWTPAHGAAVVFTAAVVALALFAMWNTSVYFHTPFEKFTGYVLGVAAFALTQLPALGLEAPAAAVSGRRKAASHVQ